MKYYSTRHYERVNKRSVFNDAQLGNTVKFIGSVIAESAILLIMVAVVTVVIYVLG